MFRFSFKMDEMKAIFLLTLIIHSWPPDDFGILIDTQTSVKYNKIGTGIQVDAFMLYTKAIFGKDILHGAKFTPKVDKAKKLWFFTYHFKLTYFHRLVSLLDTMARPILVIIHCLQNWANCYTLKQRHLKIMFIHL
jgi:hypothetical protein